MLKYINNIKRKNKNCGDCGYTTSSEKINNKKTRMSEANESE